MGLVKGGFLRLFQTFLYALLFCCAAIILGIYSYFLSVNSIHHYYSNNYVRAVEGISGAAVLYLIFAVLLTCCLGGIAFLAFLAIVLDVAFCGAMIAVAVMTRDGAGSCTGNNVQTPVGTGPSDFGAGYDNLLYSGVIQDRRSPRLHTACRENTAAFAVSIIAAFLFLITAGIQVALINTHKKEKRFGPGPSNGYTSGYGSKKRGLFGRKNKNTDAELATGATGLAVAQPDTRPSHETGFTGSTVAGTGVHDKDAVPTAGNHAGYHTAPTGTAVNPYGYNNTTTTATTGPVYTTGTATNY